MKVVILAGGSGSRLWPLSRSRHPKQFLAFGEGGSLLQKTVRRFIPEVAIQDLLIVTNQEYVHVVYAQLSLIHPELCGQVIVEPLEKDIAGKNTAPAIALAIRFLELTEQLPADKELLICPADHFIAPKERFLTLVEEAKERAREGAIITFGVRPTRPETGYGYIKAVVEGGEAPFSISHFIEKPPLEQAAAYVESGEYFWNAGIFLFTSSTFWRECEACASPLSAWREQSIPEIEKVFSHIPASSFDYAIMEKTDRAALMPLDLTWSDIGSWDSVHELLGKDEERNATMGLVHTIDTKNSLVIGGERLITTLGIEDMLIIDTEDALFIAKKGHSQRVKEVVEAYRLEGRKEVVEHRHIHRPWGSYRILEEGARYKIKRIEVHPGGCLSLQLHYHRSEHWTVVQGTAKVTIGEKEFTLHENESAYVPKSAIHRFENQGKVLLEIIEVQVGEYVGEDDIVRLDDIYGRIGKG